MLSESQNDPKMIAKWTQNTSKSLQKHPRESSWEPSGILRELPGPLQDPSGALGVLSDLSRSLLRYFLRYLFDNFRAPDP